MSKAKHVQNYGYDHIRIDKYNNSPLLLLEYCATTKLIIMVDNIEGEYDYLYIRFNNDTEETFLNCIEYINANLPIEEQ